MAIGKRIKALRENLSITQEELANRLNTTKQNIYKYENEIVTNIPSDKIEALANILNTTPAYLMGWEEKERFQKPVDINEQIKQAYGEEALEALQSFHQLDAIDRAEIRGEMKQMLKADKYTAKKGFSNGQAM